MILLYPRNGMIILTLSLLPFHFPLKGKTEWENLEEVLGEAKYDERT